MMTWRQWLRWWLAASTPVQHTPQPEAAKSPAGEELSPGHAAAILHHPAAGHPANAAQLSRAAQRLQQDVGNRGVQLLAGERGQPLAPELQHSLGSEVGADLNDVRIHSGPAGAEVAHAAAADAFTVGHDIVFGAGQYAPQTPAGRQLLAHEMAHTVQAGSGEAGNVARLESEAQSGQPPTPGAAGLGQVLRQASGKGAPAAAAPAKTPPKAPPKPAPAAPPPPRPPGGLSARQLVDYRAEAAVQAALVHSSLRPYIGGKVEAGVKVEGSVTFLDPVDFTAAYVAHAGRTEGALAKARSVRGFYDPATQEIFLARSPNLDTLLHATIHHLAGSSFGKVFGQAMDAAVAQFFTSHVLQEHGLPAGNAYPSARRPSMRWPPPPVLRHLRWAILLARRPPSCRRCSSATQSSMPPPLPAPCAPRARTGSTWRR